MALQTPLRRLSRNPCDEKGSHQVHYWEKALEFDHDNDLLIFSIKNSPTNFLSGYFLSASTLELHLDICFFFIAT
jgi:hypothetical protein